MRVEARSKRRIAIIVTLTLLVAAVLLWPRRRQVPEPSSPRAHSEPVWQTALALTEAPRTRTAAAAAPEPAPVIDEVSIEKTALCAGEENLVRVKAHTANGTDAYLHYVVAGEAGNPVPLRAFRADDGPAPTRQISVFGRGNVVTTVDVPAFHVNDCGAVPLVNVSHRLLPNRAHEFELGVRITNPPRDFRALRYQWDFGDGSSASSAEPFIVHAYEPKQTQGVYARFLVDVSVLGEGGQRLRGREALQLLNRAEQVRLERGVILVQAELTPRFPVLDADGSLHQTVRLFHQSALPVSVQNLVLERSRRGRNSAGESPAREVLDPTAVLGSASIPPGRGLQIQFTLPKEREPDVVALTYSLRGVAGPAPAQGGFSLMWPPEPPTREHSDPVTSPELKAKILSAQRILGKPFVSAEELHDLEQRGALQASRAPRRF